MSKFLEHRPYEEIYGASYLELIYSFSIHCGGNGEDTILYCFIIHFKDGSKSDIRYADFIEYDLKEYINPMYDAQHYNTYLFDSKDTILVKYNNEYMGYTNYGNYCSHLYFKEHNSYIYINRTLYDNFKLIDKL